MAANNYNNNNNNNNNRAPPAHFEDLFLNGNFLAEEEDDDAQRQVAANAAAVADRLNGNPAAAAAAAEEVACWVFGYGSLCWYPGFEYNKCITGYIRGYVRRFWQGNTTHRGSQKMPGRVATLVEDTEGITWGCAYRITGQIALDYLKQRECTLGGYATLETKFFPRVASYDTPFSGEAIEVLVYVATSDNSHWLGDDCAERIAKQIVDCRGPSGHNVEYLLRLATFMHDEIPDVTDEHLFELEYLVLEELRRRGIPLWAVMGETPERIRRDSHENIRRPPTFEFTSRVPSAKLRCLNI